MRKRILYVTNVLLFEYDSNYFLGFFIELMNLALDYEGKKCRKTIRINIAIIGLHLKLFIPIGKTKITSEVDKTSGR